MWLAAGFSFNAVTGTRPRGLDSLDCRLTESDARDARIAAPPGRAGRDANETPEGCFRLIAETRREFTEGRAVFFQGGHCRFQLIRRLATDDFSSESTI